jgi:hypothetical protein
MGDLNRPQINILLFVGEINSPYGEPNDSNDYEDDSDNGGRFHVTSFPNAPGQLSERTELRRGIKVRLFSIAHEVKMRIHSVVGCKADANG